MGSSEKVACVRGPIDCKAEIRSGALFGLKVPVRNHKLRVWITQKVGVDKWLSLGHVLIAGLSSTCPTCSAKRFLHTTISVGSAKFQITPLIEAGKGLQWS